MPAIFTSHLYIFFLRNFIICTLHKIVSEISGDLGEIRVQLGGVEAMEKKIEKVIVFKVLFMAKVIKF